MLCRAWFHYTKSLEGDLKKIISLNGKVELEYGDCPQRCPKRQNKGKHIDIYRHDLCKQCPRKKYKVEFRRATIRSWELWFTAIDFEKVNFDAVLASFNSVVAVKDLPADKMTAKMAILVNLFENEKARYDKITRDNA